MTGYSVCPENTPHPIPLPQGERGLTPPILPLSKGRSKEGLPSPPLMGGDRGEGEVFSCPFVPMNRHDGLSGFFYKSFTLMCHIKILHQLPLYIFGFAILCTLYLFFVLLCYKSMLDNKGGSHEKSYFMVIHHLSYFCMC
jgi:hypothetical protein